MGYVANVEIEANSVFIRTDGSVFLRYSISQDEHDSRLFHFKYIPYAFKEGELDVPELTTGFFHKVENGQIKFFIGDIIPHIGCYTYLMPQEVFLYAEDAMRHDNFDHSKVCTATEWICYNERKHRDLLTQLSNRRLNAGNCVKTYIIHNPHENLYKIGKSKDPFARLKSFCDPDMKLIAICPQDIEKTMHKLFGNVRARGEWFRLSEQQLLDLTKQGFNFLK